MDANRELLDWLNIVVNAARFREWRKQTGAYAIRTKEGCYTVFGGGLDDFGIFYRAPTAYQALRYCFACRWDSPRAADSPGDG